MSSANSKTLNTSGINPKGARILVRPEAIEKVSKGGIILHITTEEQEEMAQVYGTLVAVGEACWPDEAKWAEPGNKVLFAKYAGQQFLGDDGAWYRIMRDKDLIAVKDVKEESHV